MSDDTDTMPIEDYLAQGGVSSPRPPTSPPATAASSCA